MSVKRNPLAVILTCVAVEKVKLPLRGGGVPLVTSSGSIGIPTLLHPLTYSAGTGSVKGGFTGQTTPTVYNTLNLGFDFLLGLLRLGFRCALLDVCISA